MFWSNVSPPDSTNNCGLSNCSVFDESYVLGLAKILLKFLSIFASVCQIILLKAANFEDTCLPPRLTKNKRSFFLMINREHKKGNVFVTKYSKGGKTGTRFYTVIRTESNLFLCRMEEHKNWKRLKLL